MRETLHEKDIIIVKILDEAGKEKLEKNDIILFKQDNNLITHRIISIEKNNITTKGDANNKEDQLIQKEDVIGKMVKVFLKIGVWEKVLVAPQVYISIIVTITLFGITVIMEDKARH